MNEMNEREGVQMRQNKDGAVATVLKRKKIQARRRIKKEG